MASLQGAQKVHSYEQMRAGEVGDSTATSHRSHWSRISRAMALPSGSDSPRLDVGRARTLILAAGVITGKRR
jgi:hypothetical protein